MRSPSHSAICASRSRKAALLASTLDEAVGTYLENERYPSRKVNEIDNRGSSFYLAMYWAQALAGQDQDAEMKERFAGVAKALADSEAKIVAELLAAQGAPMDMGGYFHADEALVEKYRRPCSPW